MTLIYLAGKLWMPETPLTSKRFTLVEKDEYSVDLEYNEDFAIIHLPVVLKFTREIYGDMILTFPKIKEFIKDMGYKDLWVATIPGDTSTSKLAQRFGFEYKGTDSGLDVYLLAEEES